MTKWILAFDGGCCACVDVIDRVQRAAGDRLDVAGLGEERVRRWRRQSMGENPVWAPTLLAVDGDRVRAWIGPRLSMRLALLLGPSRSLRVVRSLSGGDLVINDRRRLLKAVPGVAAGAFLISGGLAAPALASGSRSADATRRWVKANKGRLPTRYDDVVTYPMAYRRAIFQELEPAVRRQLWLEHFDRYRASHPELSAEQSAVIDRAAAVMDKVFTTSGDHRAAVEGMKRDAIKAYGNAEARTLIATLGPPEKAADVPNCSCASFDDWCGNGQYCNDDAISGGCNRSDFGCGAGWIYPCDGICR